MGNERDTYDDAHSASMILFLFQFLRQEKTNKMLEKLDGELRLTNRFFPNSELMETIQSLSGISTLEMKKGAKLFRCRLIGKESENDFIKPVFDAYISLIKDFIPDFRENAGMLEWMELLSCFNNQPNKVLEWEKAYQQFVEHYSKPSFWGYDEKGSDAPPPGRPTPGRINPDGISYLYTAEDIRTAILEVRPIPTQYVSVAEIELTEAIKVYSFAKPAPSDSTETDFLSLADYGVISNYFSVPNYGEKSYYLATQYISEYIKHMKNPEGQAMFDGLCFRSSLNPDGTNVVLFDVSLTKKYQICNSTLYQVKNLLGDFDRVLPMSAPQSNE